MPPSPLYDFCRRTDNHIDIRGKSGTELEELFKKAVSLREPFYK